jgi:hypothetical protein
MSEANFQYDLFLSHSAKDKAVAHDSTLSASNGERILQTSVRALNPCNLKILKSFIFNGAILRFMGRAGVRCRSLRLRADGLKLWFDDWDLQPSST